MPIITISILPDGAIPVDKMSEEGESCPAPTKDDELNQANKLMAIEEASYGDPVDSEKICGTCAAYNQTDEMLECIDDDTGALGYCQIWKFSCMSDKWCESWAEGGPMTSDKQAAYKDII